MVDPSESHARDASARSRARGGASATSARARSTTRSVTVLDEDAYTARLEAIIERDYFPDLRSNRLKGALLEATNAGDALRVAAIHREMGVERMRRASSRGGVIGTPSIGGSGTTSAVGALGDEESWETETPRRRDVYERYGEDEGYGKDGEDGLHLGPSTAYEEDRHLSVDGFLARYTSEDNAAFSEIVKQSEARRALKKHQLEEMTAPASRRLALGTASMKSSRALVKRSETGEVIDSSDKAKAIVGHDNYFIAPEGLALSVKERGGALTAMPRVTIAKNTRFVDPLPRNESFDDMSGKEKVKQYDRVHTPSMTPGVHASPLMTWGEIASTPLRLDDTDTNLTGAGGRFSMKAFSAKEKKLRQLTSKNSAASTTPRPRGHTRSITPSGLSDAAKSLLRRVTPGRRATTPRGDLDVDLRKSYSGQIRKVSSRRATPSKRPVDGGDLLRLD